MKCLLTWGEADERERKVELEAGWGRRGGECKTVMLTGDGF